MVIHSKTCKKQQSQSGKCVCGWKEIDPVILQPCPFCGARPHMIKSNFDDLFDVFDVACSTCGGTTGQKKAKTQREAADRWNLRA